MWWAELLNNILAVLADGAGAAATSYESIATVTVGAGGQSTITFSSIPQTYKHLQLRGIARATTGNDNVYISAINGDSGSNYVGHVLYGNGASAAAGYSAANTYVSIGKAFTSTTPGWAATIVDILDYTNTNKYKTMRCLSGVDDNGQASGPIIQLSSVLWMNTGAISSFNLTTYGNFPQYSQFALYGVKG